MTHSIDLDHTSGIERTVICPMCGHSFICSLSSSCWCVTRKVPQELKDYLAGLYTTCVCSSCLDGLIEKAGAGEFRLNSSC